MLLPELRRAARVHGDRAVAALLEREAAVDVDELRALARAAQQLAVPRLAAGAGRAPIVLAVVGGARPHRVQRARDARAAERRGARSRAADPGFPRPPLACSLPQPVQRPLVILRS